MPVGPGGFEIVSVLHCSKAPERGVADGGEASQALNPIQIAQQKSKAREHRNKYIVLNASLAAWSGSYPSLNM